MASSIPKDEQRDQEQEQQQHEQPQQQQEAVKECMHKTKTIQFLGRTTPIVLQNDNGPCPLLAICKPLCHLGFYYLYFVFFDSEGTLPNP